jgi:SAM-dependent methyltransferase
MSARPPRSSRLEDTFEDIYRKVDPWQFFTSAYELRKYERQMLAIADRQSPRTILEIGCAEGAFTRQLAEKFPAAAITAIDISRAAIERAKAAFLHLQGVTFLHADIRRWARRLKPHAYDVVVWGESLDAVCRELRLPDLAALLELISAAVAPAGVLCLTNTLGVAGLVTADQTRSRLFLRFCCMLFSQHLTAVSRASYVDVKAEDSQTYEYELLLFSGR